MIQLPDRPGTGFELYKDIVEKHTLEKWEFTK